MVQDGMAGRSTASDDTATHKRTECIGAAGVASFVIPLARPVRAGKAMFLNPDVPVSNAHAMCPAQTHVGSRFNLHTAIANLLSLSASISAFADEVFHNAAFLL
jgi:hypothetical protein